MKRTIQKLIHTPCVASQRSVMVSPQSHLSVQQHLNREYKNTVHMLAKKKRAGTMSTENLAELESKQRLTQASGFVIDGEWVPQPYNDLLPQPVKKYTGSKKKISVAYILTRPASITPDSHPMEQMERQQNIEERNRYSRHNFADLWQYGVHWKREFSKLPEKKKKKSVADLAGERFDIREAPQRPEKEEILFQCALGGTRFTPHEQYFFSTYEPQPKYTQGDFEEGRKNVRRALSKQLYLIVKYEGETHWKFPEVEQRMPETLRYAAQKKFTGDMGDLLQGYFDSHAPIAHMDRADDDQLFFYTTTYLAGRPPLKRLTREGWADHVWVTRDELVEYAFENEAYKKILLDVLH